MDYYDLLLSQKLNGGGGSTLITKNISLNGTYNASSDNADGYSKVVVNVPNTYVAGDNGKVVSNGALVSQTSDTYTANGTYDTTLVNSVTVNVSGGGSAFTLLNTITVSEDVRGVNVDVSAYGNDYDFFFVYIDFTLTASDYLYFVRNGNTPSGGSYTSNSRTGFKGFCSFMMNSNLFNNQKRGIVGSQGYNTNGNNESYDYNNLYIYTYSSSKSIKSGSFVKIYGGKYADL